MILWKILLIEPILITRITLIIILILIIKELKNEYKVLKILSEIANQIKNKEIKKWNVFCVWMEKYILQKRCIK